MIGTSSGGQYETEMDYLLDNHPGYKGVADSFAKGATPVPSEQNNAPTGSVEAPTGLLATEQEGKGQQPLAELQMRKENIINRLLNRAGQFATDAAPEDIVPKGQAHTQGMELIQDLQELYHVRELMGQHTEKNMEPADLSPDEQAIPGRPWAMDITRRTRLLEGGVRSTGSGEGGGGVSVQTKGPVKTEGGYYEVGSPGKAANQNKNLQINDPLMDAEIEASWARLGAQQKSLARDELKKSLTTIEGGKPIEQGPKGWENDKITSFKEAWQRGDSYSQLNKDYGLNNATLNQTRKDLNLEPRGRPGKEWSEEDSTRLQSLVKQGKTYQEIADEMGMSRSMVAGKIDRTPRNVFQDVRIDKEPGVHIFENAAGVRKVDRFTISVGGKSGSMAVNSTDPKNLSVPDMWFEGGSQSLGLSRLRTIARQLKEHYPEAETLTAHHVSGTRGTPGVTGTSVSPTVKVDLKTMKLIKSTPENERISKPAMQIGDKVYEGMNHPDALFKAIPDHPGKDPYSLPFREGYTTSTGRFVSKIEAELIAKEQGQYNESGLTKAIKKLDPSYQGLESSSLIRDDMPKD